MEPAAASAGPTDRALAWATERLLELGTAPTGSLELVKRRPWSAVHRLPVDGGVVWVKACGGRTGYEAPLNQALATWVPDLVLTPLATDDDEGWLLLPDGGTPLRERADGSEPAVWSRFVQEYAGLQRAVAAHAGELLALGVPDQRPPALPGLLDELVDDPQLPLESAVRTDLVRLRPAFADACAELVAGGGALGSEPVSVQHDDLHAGNVLPADRPGRPDRFFDWGDACVAHPFTTLLVTLRSMAATSGLPAEHPALRAMRDAYLSGWEVEGPQAVRLARLAAWTGCVGRALAWRRALHGAPPQEAAEWTDAVPGWLAELLEPTPAWFEDGTAGG